jgi:hypothetical protein
MDIVPFEQLRVTTMTLVIALNSQANTEAAFLLLPITRINITQSRESTKCKLPHCQVPGSILSMRYRENIRGVIRNKSKAFKNSVTIDISTTRKNINLKLSPTTIQMCGASSREDGVEAVAHVINHLKYIQQVIDKMQDNIEHTNEIIKWIKDITHGDSVERPMDEARKVGNINMIIRKNVMERAIVRPMVSIPDHFDVDITRFLLSLVDDFIYHGDMCQKLDLAVRIKDVIDDNLEIKHVDEAMVNYNYSLGYEVDRICLSELINGNDDFVSHFDNALDTSVTIELPYTPPANMAIKRRKNKIPHVTFLVYKSGSITQSGPGGEIMRDAYYKFMRLINKLQPHIRIGC